MGILLYFPLIFFYAGVKIMLQTQNKQRSVKSISSKQAKEALERVKQEAANEVGVNLKQGYNGDLTSRQAGSIGGQMVKKMIESYENNMR